VNRWIQRINDHGITKWILYLAAIEDGNEINLERIQQELKAHQLPFHIQSGDWGHILIIAFNLIVELN
jgi:hypothetical protein